jgi:phosphoglycolate phosphatase-like HAD superfamily hydrolase
LWGYRQDHEDPSEWGADAVLASPGQLLDPANWPQLL